MTWRDDRRPEDDEPRLAQWRAAVAVAPRELSATLGLPVSPDDGAEGLIPVWRDVLPQIGPPTGHAEELPDWVRWPEFAEYASLFSARTLTLAGLVAGVYGTVLQRVFSLPATDWLILRSPDRGVHLREEGYPVLARPGRARDGLPHAWVSPLQDVLVLCGVQTKTDWPAAAPPVGRNDPRRLAALVEMRREEMG